MTAPETPKMPDGPTILDIQRVGGLTYVTATRVADLFAALRARLEAAEAERDAARDHTRIVCKEAGNALSRAVARVAELEAALDKYGGHVHSGPITNLCDLTMNEAYDPNIGFKVRGKWQREAPKCTCGLDDLLRGNP